MFSVTYSENNLLWGDNTRVFHVSGWEAVHITCLYQVGVSVTLSCTHSNHSLSPSQSTNGSQVHMMEVAARWGEQEQSCGTGAMAIEPEEVRFSGALEATSSVGTLETPTRMCPS